MISKLDTAIKKMDAGNTQAVINEINVFINVVEANIKTGKLSSTEGQAFIDAANSAVNAIN